MLEWIAIGSWVFWSIFTVACIIEFVSASNEKLWPSILTFLGFCAVMGFFSDFNIITYCSENWIEMLAGFGVYVFIGIVWATVKWVLMARKRGKIYAYCLERWSEISGSKVLSIDHIRLEDKMNFFRILVNSFKEASSNLGWGEYWEMHEIREHSGHSKPLNSEDKDFEKEINALQNTIMRKVLSSPFQHKEKIAVWMSAWPFSMVSSFLFDFLCDLFDNIRKLLNGFYVWLSKMAFGKYRRDFDNVVIKDE